MQNFLDGAENENINEESSSFCSSCKSILQSICSVGESSLLDEFIDEPIEKVNIQKWIGKSETILGITRVSNKTTKEHTSNNNKSGFIKNKNLTCIESLEKPNLSRLSNTENILNRRKRILEIARSILQLSNYIDEMRKIILQGIYKEQFIQKRQKNINEIPSDSTNGRKPLTRHLLPIYRYNSLCDNEKLILK